MKNLNLLFTLSLISLFLASCSGPESPIFIEMKNVKVQDIRNNEVFLEGEAVFKNPNPIAGKLVKTDIDVVVNDIEVGTIRQELLTDIQANSEFIVPVKVNFPMSKMLKNKKGLLKGLMNALLDQKASVHYEGTVTINFLKINFETEIIHDEEVSLKE